MIGPDPPQLPRKRYGAAAVAVFFLSEPRMIKYIV